MNPYSRVSVLSSIVIGLGITRILTGIGYLVQLRGQVRSYWIHLMWAHNTLLYMVMMWWVQYRWSARADWTFFLAYLLVFIVVALIPERRSSDAFSQSLACAISEGRSRAYW